MTVKDFAEYLLNNFDHDKEIVTQKYLGDVDTGEYDEIEISNDTNGYNTVTNEGNKVLIY